jgi:hypothetical protein
VVLLEDIMAFLKQIIINYKNDFKDKTALAESVNKQTQESLIRIPLAACMQMDDCIFHSYSARGKRRFSRPTTQEYQGKPSLVRIALIGQRYSLRYL